MWLLEVVVQINLEHGTIAVIHFLYIMISCMHWIMTIIVELCRTLTFFTEHFVQQALPLSLCLVLFSLKCRQCYSQTSMEECLQNVNSVECYANQKCYSSTSKYHGNLQFYNKGCVDDCDAIKICGPPNKCKVSNLCEI